MSVPAIDFVPRAHYAEVTAHGAVSADHFIDMYERLFQHYQGCETVNILVNILDYQNQLSVEDFSRILGHADACAVGFIHMVVVTLDPARPLIGQMLQALAVNFKVDIIIDFAKTMDEGALLLAQDLARI